MNAIIDGAIDIFRERGWVRGVAQDEITGAYCLGAAMEQSYMRCLGLAPRHDPVAGHVRVIRLGETVAEAAWRQRVERQYGAAHYAVMSVIKDRCRTVDSIPEWNDDYARDIDEVLEVLKLAGERADTEGTIEP